MKRLKRTFSEKFGRLSSSSDDNRIKITKDFDSEPIDYSNDLSPSTPEICECQGLRWDRNENTMILKKDFLHIEDAAHRSSSWSNSTTCPKCSLTKMTHANSFHGRKGTLGSLSENHTAETFAEGSMWKPRSKSESTTTPKRRYSSLSDPKSPFGKLDSYEFLELLGEGSYATVYKGKFKNSDQTVALKKVALNSEEGTPFTAIREVSLLKTLKHANIVTLYDIIHTNATLTLVFEYMYTDLSMYMEKCGVSKGINPRNAVLFIFQLLRGLDFCHKKKILHRDLKPQNLLISEIGELKLADFGLARAKSIPTNTYSNEVVTLWYRPPDVLLGSTNYTTSLDMWGVGCIFLEMLIGTPVCPGQTDACDQLCKIFELLGTPNPSTWPRLPDLANYDEYFYSCFIIPRQRIQLSVLIPALLTLEYGEEFAYSLLQFEPSLRLSAEDAMKHPMCDLLPRDIHLLSETDSIFTINQVKLSPEENSPKPLMMIG